MSGMARAAGRKADPTLRFRVDFAAQCSVGLGKVELLEEIGRSGSLSKAARRLGMSYRRAWLLLADLNNSFDRPVAALSVGGAGGGGALLTPFGEQLITAYRRLEAVVQPLARSFLQEFGKRVKATRRAPPVSPASLKRRVT